MIRRALAGCALVLAAGLAAGCTDTRSPGNDAGPLRDAAVQDAGPLDVDSSAAALDTVSWSVTGARVASFEFDGDTNYVSCSSNAGELFLDAATFAGGGDSIFLAIDGYDGPGTYDYTYEGSGADPSGNVRMAGGYSYWFHQERASDLSTIPSNCSVSVAELGTQMAIDVACGPWFAQVTSPDFDDEDAAGVRPSVSVSAQFRCTL